MTRLPVRIWSDIACPWCHVGKRRFEAALERFAQADAVDVSWHSFELDPTAPREIDPKISYGERLARKYGCSLDEAQGMIRTMTDTAAGEGLDFRFDRIRPGNTFDAHRLLHLAGRRGLTGAAKERLLTGYLSEGVAIGDPEALARLAVEAGLDAAEVRAVLGGEAYADDVRADEAEARERGISGVPFFLIGDGPGISGAHPPEVLLGALNAAWSRLVASGPPDGLACGPTGCC